MTKELILFAQLLLQENFEEFATLMSDYKKSDRKKFVRQHRKMIERCEYDITDLLDESDNLETLLFMAFAVQTKRMRIVDWSGEEYDGQVKRGITTMLNRYGEGNFNWNSKKYYDSLDLGQLKRGDYIPLLLSAMDRKLETLGYRIVIFDNFSDSYHYCLLTNRDFNTVNGLQTDEFAIVDTKNYAVYLVEQGTEKGKILLYLKNKFSIPLNEIKTFADQPNLLLATGNLITATKEKIEIEKIGGKVRIEEIGNW